MQDKNDDVSFAVKVLDSDALENYVHEILQHLRSPDDAQQRGPYQLTMNEQHRPKMIRAILGMSKVEFKQRLRELQIQYQWKLADDFLRHQLQPLIFTVDVKDSAPNLSSGIQNYLETKQDPFAQQQPPLVAKFFSTLARGRTYQGKMEHLLKEIAPNLLNKYREIVADLSEHDLLQQFINQHQKQQHQQHGGECWHHDDDTMQQLLQQCLTMEFVQAPPEPLDGGRSKGRQGEVDLQSYLTALHSIDDSVRVLSPVWIRPLGAHKIKSNNNKKCKYVLEVPSQYIQTGMTNEFDAMIVRLQGDTVTIEQVWDAKATLDPSSIHDILYKKVSSLRSLLTADDVLSSGKFVIAKDDENSAVPSSDVYNIQLQLPCSNSTSKSTTTTTVLFPKIGLFGSKLPSPRAAARRLQVTVCEVLLESNREIVETVLKENTGKLPPPTDMVVRYATQLLTRIREVKPIVVVPDLKGGASE
ncbi:hypothetical protein IV203_013998 [Nitzschia inconspicua]|uniref:Uncharacterized protein n=1 Tax=Nitzschia inconspicua TaxID=303405 RepID=A0A9K3M6E1_9STRA|nr:hypothetical protein IV203_014220 [Nitzschia inconspicua]KAG7374903.1 hypothetical protein IV203_013998 [Nitzschia inconspicua]